MNPYRGIIRMECEEDRCSKVRGRDIEPDCINCKAAITIVDHGGKILARLGTEEQALAIQEAAASKKAIADEIKAAIERKKMADDITTEEQPDQADVKSRLTGTSAIRNQKSKITKEEVM